jgi:glycosyltransferase involved in cell wall biosynthesis
VDDGSIDGTYDVIAAFGDNRIRYCYQENQGTSSARNKGIELADGKFVLFVDADDWIDCDYLETIYRETLEHEADLYVFGLSCCKADGQLDAIQPCYLGMMSQLEFLTGFASAHYINAIGIYGYIPNKLLLRKIIIENCIRFNPKLKLQEDYDFFLSYYKYCRKIYCFSYTGYYYEYNSSINRRGPVDYISLIQIQLKCLDLLKLYPETFTDENKNILSSVIANLAMSAFLELKPVTIGYVKQISHCISSREEIVYCVRQYETSFRTLKQLVLSGNGLAIYLYLLVWRLHLYIHQK